MTPNIIESFRKTRPWVLFLSILGFISTGIMIVAMLCVSLGKLGSRPEALAVGLIAALFQIVVAMFIYLVPAVLLGRYAARIRDLLAAPNEMAALEGAIRAQKSFWRYTGILVMVAICITILAVVAAVVAGLIGAAK